MLGRYAREPLRRSVRAMRSRPQLLTDELSVSSLVHRLTVSGVLARI